ncbi:MAG: hypothetical protein Q7S27_00385 [Nanoarchaeota archaeon]|nr:hypothetical protein [Nanoarchaeota archaeon]
MNKDYNNYSSKEDEEEEFYQSLEDKLEYHEKNKINFGNILGFKSSYAESLDKIYIDEDERKKIEAEENRTTRGKNIAYYIGGAVVSLTAATIFNEIYKQNKDLNPRISNMTFDASILSFMLTVCLFFRGFYQAFRK